MPAQQKTSSHSRDGLASCGSDAGPCRLTHAVLIYDGDCGFCTSAARLARRFAPGTYQGMAWQEADLEALGLSERSCERALQWVGATGEHYEGAAAFSALLRGSDSAFSRALGQLLSFGVTSAMSGAFYALVAANRHRLPGGTPACRLPRGRRPG